MEHSKVTISEVSEIVSDEFSKSGFTALLKKDGFETLNEFRDYLTQKLTTLMDENYDLLLTTLYRIDIDEEKLHRLFAGDNREFIPSALADLIIERQLQKVYFRHKYKEGKL